MTNKTHAPRLSDLLQAELRGMNNHQMARFRESLVHELPKVIKQAADRARDPHRFEEIKQENQPA